MHRTWALVAALTMTMGGLFTGTASAQGNGNHDHDGLRQHGHMLLLHADVQVTEDGVSVTYDKCIDLAAGHELRLRAHHESVHMGKAGEALRTKAGHLVVPTSPFPFADWKDCADFARIFPGD